MQFAPYYTREHTRTFVYIQISEYSALDFKNNAEFNFNKCLYSSARAGTEKQCVAQVYDPTFVPAFLTRSIGAYYQGTSSNGRVASR